MKTDVLDHGYVALVESWGSDERIIEAARMSTGKGFNGWGERPECLRCGETDLKRVNGRCQNVPSSSHDWTRPKPGDEKLLRYLWENKHATPFEMAGLILEVQAPIFVFREWHRHRTQSYNEMSARYVPLPDVNYVPSMDRLMTSVDTKNKQAAPAPGSFELTEKSAVMYRSALVRQYEEAEKFYRECLEAGVPKELARVHLPVGRYSRMRASANLRNWLAFLTLRMATNAQYEIRVYASAVGAIVAETFPRTWELFEQSREEKERRP